MVVEAAAIEVVVDEAEVLDVIVLEGVTEYASGDEDAVRQTRTAQLVECGLILYNILYNILYKEKLIAKEKLILEDILVEDEGVIEVNRTSLSTRLH